MNPLGLPIQVTEPFHVTLTMRYNGLGQRTYIGDSDDGSVASTINAIGLPTVQTLSEGTTSLEIDSTYTGDLLTATTRSVNGGAVGTDAYTYTPTGQVATVGALWTDDNVLHAPDRGIQLCLQRRRRSDPADDDLELPKHGNPE